MSPAQLILWAFFLWCPWPFGLLHSFLYIVHGISCQCLMLGSGSLLLLPSVAGWSHSGGKYARPLANTYNRILLGIISLPFFFFSNCVWFYPSLVPHPLKVYWDTDFSAKTTITAHACVYVTFCVNVFVYVCVCVSRHMWKSVALNCLSYYSWWSYLWTTCSVDYSFTMYNWRFIVWFWSI